MKPISSAMAAKIMSLLMSKMLPAAWSSPRPDPPMPPWARAYSPWTSWDVGLGCSHVVMRVSTWGTMCETAIAPTANRTTPNSR